MDTHGWNDLEGWHEIATLPIEAPDQLLADITQIFDREGMWSAVSFMSESDLHTLIKDFVTFQFGLHPLDNATRQRCCISAVTTFMAQYVSGQLADRKNTVAVACADVKTRRVDVLQVAGFKPDKSQASLNLCLLNARLSAIPEPGDKTAARITVFEPYMWIAWLKMNKIVTAEDLYAAWQVLLKEAFPHFLGNSRPAQRFFDHIKTCMVVLVHMHKEFFVTLNEPFWLSYLDVMRSFVLGLYHLMDSKFRRGAPPAMDKWKELSTIPFPRWMREIWVGTNPHQQAPSIPRADATKTKRAKKRQRKGKDTKTKDEVDKDSSSGEDS